MPALRHSFLRKTNLLLLPLLLLTGLLHTGCQDRHVSDDPSLRLRFSSDSVLFDTVFTGFGSSTQTVMVYNPNRNAVTISDIVLESEWFHINLDGENDRSLLHDITLHGGDSLYLFVRVYIPEQNENTPVLVTDTIHFFTNGNRQDVSLMAYGQDVHVVRSSQRRTDKMDFTFQNNKPWLVFDTMVFRGRAVLPEGTTIYMHEGANLFFCGGIAAHGSAEHPVRITGDRLDKLFAHVPYQAASGQWGGIRLLTAKEDTPHRDTLAYTEILSGNIGLYCTSEQTVSRPHLVLANCRIHNHAAYGVVLHNTDAEIWNTEISNCASYCLYLSGGRHRLTHTTIASYFGWPHTNLNIHNTGRDDVAALYINNLDKESAVTKVHLTNSIVAGSRKNNLVLATALPAYYEGEFSHNYLQADSLPETCSHDNLYGDIQDTVFRNTWYRYKEYVYYDFRPDSISPAIGIGDGSVVQNDPRLHKDRNGLPRSTEKPTAGCYEPE